MSSGTQSPPLEFTGEDKALGSANKKGEPVQENVKDADQRAAYFPGEKQSSNIPNVGAGVSKEAKDDAKKAAESLETERGH